MGNYLYQKYQYKAPEIRFLPSKVTYNEMRKYLNSINSVPIGYNIDDVEIYEYNFLKKRCNIILGNNLIDNVTFYGGIIDLIDEILNINFTIIDLANSIDFEGNALFYQGGFSEVFDDIAKEDKEDIDNNKINLYLLIGVGNITNTLTAQEIQKFNYIMENINNFSNSYFILVDDVRSFKNISSYNWYNKLDFSCGIWVGEDIESQDIFQIDKIEEETDKNDIAYVIENGNYQILKVMGDNLDKNNEEKGLGDFLNG